MMKGSRVSLFIMKMLLQTKMSKAFPMAELWNGFLSACPASDLFVFGINSTRSNDFHGGPESSPRVAPYFPIYNFISSREVEQKNFETIIIYSMIEIEKKARLEFSRWTKD